VRAGVPQGSILGPLLFLIYINDIVADVNSNIRLFADDTSLFLEVDHANNTASALNADIKKITDWAKTWLVTFNPNKTESLLISRKLNKPIHPPLEILDTQISEVTSHKHLGVYLSNDCSWHSHIDYIKSKAWIRINIMRKLKYVLDRKSLEIIYLCFIRPLLEYADIIWDNCTNAEKLELDKIQNEAARIAIGATKLISLDNLRREIGWENLDERRRNHKLTLLYKMKNNLTPNYLSSLIPPQVNSETRYPLRNSNNIQLPHARTQLYYNSFLPAVVREWNSLSQTIKDSESLPTFKHLLNSSRIIPSYFYSGERKLQLLHARLRTNCSTLNLTLFQRNIIESPQCICGDIESIYHYLIACPAYRQIRMQLFEVINPIRPPTVKLLLNGDPTLPDQANEIIFKAVQMFILQSKRFN
jgi:hypothetical protein